MAYLRIPPEIRGEIKTKPSLSDFLCKWQNILERTRSFPNSMANRFKACPHSLTGIAHFFEALRTAKYIIFSTAPSVENSKQFLVTFRN
jgi:hypothetical protein